MSRIRTVLALLALLLPAGAWAHPLAPGLLELTEVAPARYAVLWRTSVARAGSASVEPRLPAECERWSQPEPRVESGEALVARWVVQCPAGGLAQRTLSVDGLAGSGINVIVRVLPQGAEPFQALLGADQPEVAVTLASPAPLFGRYLRLGAEHMLGGLDHVLFVLGLFLLVTGLRRLVVAVTAFTVGHSITLALATLGVVTAPPELTEILIAATLLWLALEMARRPRAAPPQNGSILLLGVGFGLIHGLGFAGALREAGLPVGDVPLALLAFNTGIELAQLALVAALLLAAAWRRLSQAPRLAPLLPAYATGSLAACWLLERTAVLLA